MPKRHAFGAEERRMVGEAVAHYQAVQYDFGYQGVFEKRYCDAFIELQGGGHADAVATGTGALYVGLAALELPERSDVMVSPITDPGTVSAIILRGHRPLLLDGIPGSYNMDPAEIERCITKRTAALVVVHCTGQPVDMDAVMSSARRHGLKVLEDCSQAHGATWNGAPVGTFGDAAAFSTMYRKSHMTGSSGGVVFTRDAEVYHRLLAHADRGKPRWRADFDDRDPDAMLFPALNWHTDEISCAIGIASIQRLKDTIRRRRDFVESVSTAIESRCRSVRPLAARGGLSPFVLPIFVKTDQLSCTAQDFALALRAEGIDLNPHYKYLISDWHWVRPHLAEDRDTQVARRARDESFCLYLNENYGPEEVADITAAIEKVEGHFLRN